MHPLIDSHAHYDDHRFEEEFEGGTDGAIRAAREAGVEYIVNIGSSLRSSRNSIELADRYDFIYAAVGLHPYDVQQLDPADLDNALYQVEELSKHEKVRAIGEIGFDYHYDGTDKERQSYFFAVQMEIAQRVGLPVIIHSRDAAGDTFDMIRRYPKGRTPQLQRHSGNGASALRHGLVHLLLRSRDLQKCREGEGIRRHCSR